ncbi:MAG: hypothetical protein RL006_945 [Chloroflexota bacterium]|jgi:hypothetical protein
MEFIGYLLGGAAIALAAVATLAPLWKDLDQ